MVCRRRTAGRRAAATALATGILLGIASVEAVGAPIPTWATNLPVTGPGAARAGEVLLLLESPLRAAETVSLRALDIDGAGGVTVQAVGYAWPVDYRKLPGITLFFEELEKLRGRLRSVRLKRIQKTQENRIEVALFTLTFAPSPLISHRSG